MENLEKENNLESLENRLEEMSPSTFVEIHLSCFKNYMLRWDKHLSSELKSYSGMEDIEDMEELDNFLCENDIYGITSDKFNNHFDSLTLDEAEQFLDGYNYNKEELILHLSGYGQDSIYEIIDDISSEHYSGYAHRWLLLDLYREINK